MIRTLTKVQLAAFTLITIVAVSILSANYIGLTERLLGGGPLITASFAQSGGIFVGSEVTYRGVKIGRVSGLELEKDGVLVEAQLDRPWPDLIAAGHAVATRAPQRRDVRVPLERAALLAVGRAGGAVTRRLAAFVEGWVPGT